MKASVLFEQIINDEIANHSLTVTAMVHLSDLLLLELNKTGDNKLLEEIKNLNHKLLEIANKQSSFSLLIDAYRLEAMISLVELDLKKARELLARALSIAEEKGIERSAAIILEELQKLEEQIELWDELSKRNAPLKETLQHVQIEKPIKQMQKDDFVVNTRLYSFKI